MNRRTKLVPATTAVIIAVLALASVASAAPVVSADNVVNATRATFQDSGPGPTTDNLTVSAAIAGGNLTIQFHNGTAMSAVPPCTGNNTTTVTCTIVNAQDNGVTIDLGAAAATPDQQAALTGGGWGLTENFITGGPGADTLSGSAGKDTFFGLGSGDDFTGSLGVDTVSYDGIATAVVAQIDDAPDSGAGCPDTCEGDTISATIENLTGGDGNDTLTGDSGVNTLSGGAGNDTLNGLVGDDHLFGETGDDTLIGGLGNDELSGGAINTESDTVSYLNDGRTSGVTVSLSADGTSATSGTETDSITLRTVENIVGSIFDDHLRGSTYTANVIKGEAGADELFGDAEGGDPIGPDDVFGGGGTDVFRYDDGRHSGSVNVSLNDTADDGLLDADSASGSQPEGDNIHSDVENLVGTDFPDTLAGSAATNVLNGGGGGGIDTISYAGRTDGVTASLVSMTGPEGDTFTGANVRNLTGGTGNDTLIGNGSVNALNGAGGNDTLIGGAGNDPLTGGAGSDTADYSQDVRGAGVDVDLLAGAQSVHAGSAEDTLATIENVTGTANDDNLTGDTNDNVLTGGGGVDRLDGSSANDTLDPGTGNGDTVLGGLGSDTVTYASRTAAVSISPNNVADDGEAGEGDNVFPTVENAIGGGGDDALTANTAAAAAGIANIFVGGAGADTIKTLGGDDKVTGGAGADNVETGDGDDTLALTDQTKDTADCGAGNDTADADDIDALSNCETVTRHAIPVTPPPPGPAASAVTVNSPTVKEGNTGTTDLVFTVTLSAAQAEAVGVPFQTGGGTATAGTDYTAQTGTLAFAAGETSKTVAISVIGDKRVEKSETLGLVLGTPTGNAALGTPAAGVGTITNDDTARKAPRRLTAHVAPKRDKTAPFAFVVTGKLTPAKGVSKKRGCAGKVRVTVKAGTKKLRTRTGFVDATCNYTVPVSLSTRKGIPKSGRLTFVARFLGNKALKPKSAKSVSARAG